jgi:hypothetical protein
MDPTAFDELQRTFTAQGPAAAIDQLCARLHAAKDYDGLFYALLMKKRHELGVCPVPTAPAQELPAAVHAAFEDGIRAAARRVGGLYLEDRNLPAAWRYFQIIGETAPVAEALEQYQPGAEEDLQPLLHIAFYEGVHPRKGFDWLLERNGICNAITTLGTVQLPSVELRRYCVGRLVRALYQELVERLQADLAQRTGAEPAGAGLRELLAGHEWNFEEEYAHVDVSHLSSVVQMSVVLQPGPELELARELCEYGKRLSGRLQYGGDPPFEDLYPAYGLYLAALAGEQVEEAVAYFRAQAEAADPETVGTYPAEVLVNFLLRLDRPAEALAAARRWLANADGRQLSCPSIPELCRQTGDYRTLAEVAREQGDAVHFVAGLAALAWFTRR